jgi:hypothetical protein
MMKRYRARIFVAALAAAALCNCSGGVGIQPLAVQTPIAGSTPTPVMTTARFTITIPAAGSTSVIRAPKFVSPSTQSAIVTLVSVNGTPYTGTPASIASNLTPSNPACSGVPLTCTITAPAVAGSDAFTFVSYDAPQTSTSPGVPVGNVLSKATLTVNVIAGQANTTTALALNGVVDHVDIGLATATGNAGTPSSVAVSVNARDKDNNIIVGPGHYVDSNGNALTVNLTDSDVSGATSLAPVSITSPAAVTLTYTGAAPPPPSLTATIGASISGGSIAGTITGAAFTVRVAPTLTTLSYATWIIGNAVTETLTGTNFVAGATTIALSGTGVTVSSVNVASSTSLTATFTVAGGAALVAQNVTVTTAGGTSAAQPFTPAAGTIVSAFTDAAPGAPPGSGAGVAGDLRHAIINSNPGDTIVFNCAAPPCTITLGGPLPPITHDLTIDGGTFGNLVVDGNSLYRAFWADSGTVTLHALHIQNVLAQGGAGGTGFPTAGGGGLGAGAGLFIRLAAVTLSAVYFSGEAVAGGAGGAGQGSGSAGGGGGGGGGLAGTGGAAGPPVGPGGGGVVPGGSLVPAVHGGAGANGDGTSTTGAGGGGGAAAGPAVFLFGGSLTIVNSGAATGTATGGVAGSSGAGAPTAAAAGTADATPVFNFGGTVNGSATTGPVAGALPNVLPSSVERTNRK